MSRTPLIDKIYQDLLPFVKKNKKNVPVKPSNNFLKQMAINNPKLRKEILFVRRELHHQAVPSPVRPRGKMTKNGIVFLPPKQGNRYILSGPDKNINHKPKGERNARLATN